VRHIGCEFRQERRVLADCCADRLPSGPEVAQVGIYLLAGQRPHQDSPVEPERLGKGVAVGRATGDNQGKKAVRLAEHVDGPDARGAVLRLDLVEPVEKRQHLVRRDPFLGDLAGDVVPKVQLVLEPFNQGLPRLGPRRDGEDDGNRMSRVVRGAGEQVAGQLKEQRRLPRARRAEDEQRLIHGVEDVHDLSTGRQGPFVLVRALRKGRRAREESVHAPRVGRRPVPRATRPDSARSRSMRARGLRSCSPTRRPASCCG